LYRKWKYLLNEKKYCVADFWNSGVLTEGCIAYGRRGGYLYIDWNGNVMPCVFVPYVVDNIITTENRGEDPYSDAILKDRGYYQRMIEYDKELSNLTEPIWEEEYLKQPVEA
jgi:MoaA/NifB/PqqE/SkfB family radical SAM enzyme